MSAEVLEQLKSEEFASATALLSTATAIRRFLRSTREVAAVRKALQQGAITEGVIREFVSTLTRDLRRGQRFPHELAIAALAVALETRPTDFSSEFIRDLSRLQLAEMSLCIRVARECLKYRSVLAENKVKEFDVAPPGDWIPFSFGTSPLSFRNNLVGVTEMTFTCEAV